MRDPRGQRRVEVAALQSQQAEDAVEVAVRQRPHHRFDARERAACALGIPRYRDRDRARRRHEADRLVTRCPSPVGERDGRRDGRMTAEGHLGDGREGANAQRAVGFPPRDERRLGIIHLGGDALHGRVVQTLRVEHDAGGIATLGSALNAVERSTSGAGSSSATSASIRARISSRMPRTTSIGWPAGSARTQSS